MPSAKGFTLAEVLVAMVLATAILAPTSLWLYKNQSNQAATEKAQAINALTTVLNETLVLPPPDRSFDEEIPEKGWKIRVEVKREEPEIVLTGTLSDRKGKPLVTLTVSRFVELP